MAFNRSEEVEYVSCYAQKTSMETDDEVDSLYFHIIFCSFWLHRQTSFSLTIQCTELHIWKVPRAVEQWFMELSHIYRILNETYL